MVVMKVFSQRSVSQLWGSIPTIKPLQYGLYITPLSESTSSNVLWQDMWYIRESQTVPQAKLNMGDGWLTTPPRHLLWVTPYVPNAKQTITCRSRTLKGNWHSSSLWQFSRLFFIEKESVDKKWKTVESWDSTVILLSFISLLHSNQILQLQSTTPG